MRHLTERFHLHDQVAVLGPCRVAHLSIGTGATAPPRRGGAHVAHQREPAHWLKCEAHVMRLAPTCLAEVRDRRPDARMARILTSLGTSGSDVGDDAGFGCREPVRWSWASARNPWERRLARIRARSADVRHDPSLQRRCPANFANDPPLRMSRRQRAPRHRIWTRNLALYLCCTGGAWVVHWYCADTTSVALHWQYTGYRTGTTQVWHWHCKGTAWVLAMPEDRLGAATALHKYSLALHCHCTGTALVLQRCCTGPALALHPYCTDPERYRTGTTLALHWHPSNTPSSPA